MRIKPLALGPQQAGRVARDDGARRHVVRDDRAALDLDEGPDAGAVADAAAVEVRERVDDDALAELDIGEEPERRLVRGSSGP